MPSADPLQRHDRTIAWALLKNTPSLPSASLWKVERHHQVPARHLSSADKVAGEPTAHRLPREISAREFLDLGSSGKQRRRLSTSAALNQDVPWGRACRTGRF
ncbi:MAG: hypothetical protein ACKN9U_18665, partial [Pirellulaceae bacterium]